MKCEECCVGWWNRKFFFIFIFYCRHYVYTETSGRFIVLHGTSVVIFPLFIYFLVWRAVSEFRNRTDSLCLMVCASCHLSLCGGCV
ncbi:putative mucin-associated surface protein (MASP) [Trypanosoma cruzi Dm28c]|uniref:Putative mucin-associated surface protein (MASP) n=1 Tax=Trypanosoma cruzi Dm28c TaxID=1416333 RepID=V5ANB3_TRYCR|nr:putative mucin-associated surface protein (MASP) [Trypanosoma cruzi Dm28c]